MIIPIIGSILGVFLIILLVRAWRFRPIAEEIPEAASVTLNQEKIVRDMQALIQCKTISYLDEERIDRAEFEKFEKVLQERFPLLHKKSNLQRFGKTGLLYHLKGKEQEKPGVLMAHYDVVPVEEEGWEKPAFEAVIENGVMWGRGTLDTKGTVCGILEAAEQLLSEGFVPKRDMYFAFSGEEEIAGDSCPLMVEYFKQQGIELGFVVDEGGAVVENVFPGVNRECAVVGIAEKGIMNVKLTMEGVGGHASTPPKRTLLGQLSEAVVRLEKHPFRMQWTKPVAEMFDTLGRYSTFCYRFLFANLWCFRPILSMIFRRTGGELNAMLRTTCAVTTAQGSKALNVLPSEASIGLNLRLMGTDTVEKAQEYISKVIGNDKIQLQVLTGDNPSGCSDTSGEAWQCLKKAIQTTWRSAIVSPYLMMACSDARHYAKVSDKVYRFSPMKLSAEERALIHGNNERIPIDTLLKTVEFYIRLLKEC